MVWIFQVNKLSLLFGTDPIAIAVAHLPLLRCCSPSPHRRRSPQVSSHRCPSTKTQRGGRWDCANCFDPRSNRCPPPPPTSSPVKSSQRSKKWRREVGESWGNSYQILEKNITNKKTRRSATTVQISQRNSNNLNLCLIQGPSARLRCLPSSRVRAVSC